MPAHRYVFPATSANLGPGFDALALALELTLEIEAEPGAEDAITATGRSPEVCSALHNNLLLTTYRDTWALYRDDPPQPLSLRIHNGIPLGMGCGSSAASRAAGVALANDFGRLGWDRARILDEVATLEHHPDNAAACLLGGFTAAGVLGEASAAGDRTAAGEPGARRELAASRELGASRDRVVAVSLTPPAGWCALLVLPSQPLATTTSRGVLPASYTRPQIVPNLQNAGLLVAAFAAGRGDLLLAATRDGMHQPFRAAVCPLLLRLLPLAGRDGVLSVTLSGAGPGVLLLLAAEQAEANVGEQVREAAGEIGIAELLPVRLRTAPAVLPETAQTTQMTGQTSPVCSA